VTPFITLVITQRNDEVLPQSQTYLTSCKNIHSKNAYENVVLGPKNTYNPQNSGTPLTLTNAIQPIK
jgi:hypothetical protein